VAVVSVAAAAIGCTATKRGPTEARPSSAPSVASTEVAIVPFGDPALNGIKRLSVATEEGAMMEWDGRFTSDAALDDILLMIDRDSSDGPMRIGLDAYDGDTGYSMRAIDRSLNRIIEAFNRGRFGGRVLRIYVVSYIHWMGPLAPATQSTGPK
jgi:hypothetical protein